MLTTLAEHALEAQREPDPIRVEAIPATHKRATDCDVAHCRREDHAAVVGTQVGPLALHVTTEPVERTDATQTGELRNGLISASGRDLRLCRERRPVDDLPLIVIGRQLCE